MAEERTIQIQDDSGNVYCPQTKSSAVFMSDGKSIDSHLGDATALKTSAKDSFVNAINEVFQSGTNVKTNTISAVNSKGGNLSASATWDDVINAIKAIAKGQGNAVESQVLGGATFSNSDGKLRTGSMANNGAISGTITNQGQSISIPEGYTKGGSIIAKFANLIASNIKKDVNIGGITGSLDIESLGGKKWVNGSGSVQNTILVTGLSFAPSYIILCFDHGVIMVYVKDWPNLMFQLDRIKDVSITINSDGFTFSATNIAGDNGDRCTKYTYTAIE